MVKMADVLIPPSLKFLMANIRSVINIQLSTENYPLWRSQIWKLFLANEFDRFLDGSTIKPVRQSISPDGIVIPNPNYNIWNLIDQNLAATLYSPMFFVWILVLKFEKPLRNIFNLQIDLEFYKLKMSFTTSL